VKKTRICELLGIEHPVIQGGMGWISNAELAAAVSNAGALGMITPNAGLSSDSTVEEMVANLRQHIRKARTLTSKPFGVNVGLDLPEPQRLLEAALEEGVRIITTTAGSPALYTKFLKEAGAKVMHPVFSVRHARRAAAEGVDAVIASGYEAGGLLSREELTTFVLVPQVADAVNIPVIAAGGIADARGLVAALALGAEGIQMGTRFIACQECMAHPRFKEAIIKAADTDTVVTSRRTLPGRALKNELVLKLVEMEFSGAPPEEIRSVRGFGRIERALLEGDIEQGSALCGQVAGLIKEVLSAGEIVRRVVEEAEAILAKLS
jgi:enoyl-[acyl-carrier protein] reductase II